MRKLALSAPNPMPQQKDSSVTLGSRTVSLMDEIKNLSPPSGWDTIRLGSRWHRGR